jgi:putative membrane protein
LIAAHHRCSRIAQRFGGFPVSVQAHISPLRAAILPFQTMTEPSGGSGLSTSDKLGVERTRLSHDRTLMANVRTSTALISFGFTIYKFFAGMEEHGQVAESHRLLGSRNFAFLMMVIGVVFLALSSVAYIQQMKQLRERYGVPADKLPLTLAAVISILGIFGLLSIILRQ